MTTYQLGASATYHETGDMILVTTYLFDPTFGTNGAYRPQLVHSGTCTLISGETPIDCPVEFDYRNGTSEGNFQIFFIHPSSLHNLKVNLSLLVRDETTEATYDTETQVIRIEAEDLGLAEQPFEDEVF